MIVKKKNEINGKIINLKLQKKNIVNKELYKL